MPYTFLCIRSSSVARMYALLVAAVVVSCSTPSGPREIRMLGVGADGSMGRYDLTGTVDFQRQSFVADIFGQHYVGVVRLENGFAKFQARSAGGLTLDCYLNQLQRDMWVGECSDAQYVRVQMDVGSTFHM